MNEPITLSRACEVLEIPSGARHVLPMGTAVRISQSLGDSYTVTTAQGNMYRIEGKDADALGLSVDQEQLPQRSRENSVRRRSGLSCGLFSIRRFLSTLPTLA